MIQAKKTGFDNSKSIIEAFKEENFSDDSIKEFKFKKKT